MMTEKKVRVESKTSDDALNRVADDRAALGQPCNQLRKLPLSVLGATMQCLELNDLKELRQVSKETRTDSYKVLGQWTTLTVDDDDLDTWCDVEQPQRLMRIIAMDKIKIWFVFIIFRFSFPVTFATKNNDSWHSHV
jgi:hypothetical protein